MSSRRPIAGHQPKAFSLEVSINLRGAPSGLMLSNNSWPLKPVTAPIVSAKSRIVQSTPVPTLI